jgi:hypothetical protein
MSFQNDDLFLVNRGGDSFKTEYVQLKQSITEDIGVHVDTNPPADPNDGDLWFNSNDDNLYVWYVTETTGIVTGVSVRNGGSGYTANATNVETDGGSGTGLTVDIQAGVGGNFANPTVNSGGHSYSVGDVVFLTGSGHGNGSISVTSVNTAPVGQWVLANSSFWERNGTTLSPANDGDNVNIGTTSNPDNIQLNADGSATFAGNLTVPSLNDGPLAGFRNVLINGGFNFQQRNPKSELAIANGARVYYSDRWMLIPGGTDITAGLSTDNGSVYQTILPSVTGNGTSCYFIQAVELLPGFTSMVQYPFLDGSTWTLSGVSLAGLPTLVELTWSDSASNRGSVATTEGFLAPTAGANGAWSATFTIDDSNFNPFTHKCLAVRILFNDLNGIKSLGKTQLEPGPVATPFENRPLGTELALCQRYYLANRLAFALGSIEAGGQLGVSVHFPVEMMKDPIFTEIVDSNTNLGPRTYAGNSSHVAVFANGVNTGLAQLGSTFTAEAEFD